MGDKWYRKAGDSDGIVVSTRVRLARNLAQFPFPFAMSDKQREEVVQSVREAAQCLKGLSLRFLDLSSCSSRDRLAMTERHLISPEFASRASGGLLLSDDERISIMINEEDHLRIQVMSCGMDFEAAYTLADQIDTALNERLHFAFDERLGYLTQCPTNLGTGMRASLMLHLPMLQDRAMIASLSDTVSKLGLVMRGAYGESSKPSGALYQLSNQVTLGISEKDAIESLNSVAMQIKTKEATLRKECIKNEVYEDTLWRSLGILRSARLLTKDEAMMRISHLNIGVVSGLFKGISLDTVTALMQDIQPGCLMADAGEDMSAAVRDRRRASIVRTALCV